MITVKSRLDFLNEETQEFKNSHRIKNLLVEVDWQSRTINLLLNGNKKLNTMHVKTDLQHYKPKRVYV